MRAAIKHDEAIIIVIYLIIFNPAIATLNNEYTLTSRRINLVIVYYSVTWVVPSKCNIGFEICKYFISFYVCWSTLDQEYTLSEVTIDFIPYNCYLSTLNSFDTCSTVASNRLILLNTCIIFSACTYYPIIFVFFNDIELNSAVTTHEVFGYSHYTIFKVLSYSVH